MKSDIKERWIKWLESGEYNLGKHYLYDWSTDTYCPLGVLVELALEDGIDLKVKKSDYPNKTEIEGNAKITTHKVHTWAGIDHDTANTIARINDKDGTDKAIKYIKERL